MQRKTFVINGLVGIIMFEGVVGHQHTTQCPEHDDVCLVGLSPLALPADHVPHSSHEQPRPAGQFVNAIAVSSTTSAPSFSFVKAM